MATVTDLYPSPYLEAGDLDGKEITVEITTVEEHHTGKGKDGKEFEKPLLRFKGAKKGLVLNKTNAKRIRDGLGYGNEVQGWVGKKVTLYASTCNAFGKKNTPCVRIRLEEEDL